MEQVQHVQGGIGWEISVKGSDLLVIIDQIEAVDKELVKRFRNSP